MKRTKLEKKLYRALSARQYERIRLLIRSDTKSTLLHPRTEIGKQIQQVETTVFSILNKRRKFYFAENYENMDFGMPVEDTNINPKVDGASFDSYDETQPEVEEVGIESHPEWFSSGSVKVENNG